MTDGPTEEVDRPEPAQALVILPFQTPEQAETFAHLVIAQLPSHNLPIVTRGTAYEYRHAETGEEGQVFELPPQWEAYIKPDDSGHVLQRITKEATDASTG